MFFFLIACGSDISIMKRYDQEQTDSSADTTATTEVSAEPSEPSEPTTEPSQDTDTSTQVDESFTIGYLHYYLQQIACPACVGAAQEITLTMTMSTHHPTTSSYFENMKPHGTCTNQLYGTYVGITPKSYGPSVTVTPSGGGSPISLSELATGSYTSPPLMEYQYTRDTPHSIYFQGTGDIIQNAFISSHGFDDIQPWEMRYVDPSYAFAAPISRNGATFSWLPYGSSGSFVIQIDVYTWDGSQYLSSVECWGADNGMMTVPGSYLSAYQSGSLVLIHLIRHDTSSVIYPGQGTIETHMQWEVIGTGYIQ